MTHKVGFTALEEKQYYHLYNFGVDKRTLFSSKEDYDRFEAYLYLLNAVESQRASNFFVSNRASSIFESARGERLIAIGAYSFSPHDFHILARPLVKGGISKFMQKLQTAYTMYFNKKYSREGSLFQSSYKFDVISTDDNLKHYFAYIHINPIEILLTENGKNEHDVGTFIDMNKLALRAKNYRYSSINEYLTSKFVITDPKEFPKHFKIGSGGHTKLASWLKRENKSESRGRRDVA